MKREATAIWTGSVKDGNGRLTSKSKALQEVSYSWNSRFAEGTGTNPEELIAAAHAGCFSMAFSSQLSDAGYTPTSIETVATINFENGTLSQSHLRVKANVPGASEENIRRCAEEAKTNCPISKVLNLNITMELEPVKINSMETF